MRNWLWTPLHFEVGRILIREYIHLSGYFSYLHVGSTHNHVLMVLNWISLARVQRFSGFNAGINGSLLTFPNLYPGYFREQWAPGNIQGSLTGMHLWPSLWRIHLPAELAMYRFPIIIPWVNDGYGNWYGSGQETAAVLLLGFAISW